MAVFIPGKHVCVGNNLLDKHTVTSPPPLLCRSYLHLTKLNPCPPRQFCSCCGANAPKPFTLGLNHLWENSNSAISFISWLSRISFTFNTPLFRHLRRLVKNSLHSYGNVLHENLDLIYFREVLGPLWWFGYMQIIFSFPKLYIIRIL